jgi:hypothetical protein
MHQKDGACIMQSHTTSVEASAHPAAPDLGAMADALMAKMRPAPMEPAAPQPASAQVAEPVAWVWPKGRDVTRLGDMSPPGDTRLRVLFDSDNDVCVEVLQQDLARGEFALAAVEFCNGGGGGGQSPKTRKALVALMAAIEADNADAPHKAWPLDRDAAPGAAPSVQPAPDREGEKP